MLGYKIAKNGDKRVIVTLEIPSDALTNMDRPTVIVKDTATYRANKVVVLKIEDAEGNCYETATSSSYIPKSLTYTVGELIEEPTYNMDPENIYAEGIHFFLSRRVAELYRLEKVANGLYQTWHDNGHKCEEVPYIDGKIHGLYQSWHENRQKCEETIYVDGKIQGLSKFWYENGRKREETNYIDGEKHGLYQQWDKDGVKIEEATYVAGIRQ
jgi:antitoxin component YwqK of YwqJK toxin-antitoxin module